MEVAQVIKRANGYNIAGYVMVGGPVAATIFDKRQLLDAIKHGVVSNATPQYYASSTIIRVKTCKATMFTGAQLVQALCNIKKPVGIVANFRDRTQMETMLYIGQYKIIGKGLGFKFASFNRGVNEISVSAADMVMLDASQRNDGLKATFHCDNTNEVTKLKEMVKKLCGSQFPIELASML